VIDIFADAAFAIDPVAAFAVVLDDNPPPPPPPDAPCAPCAP